MRASLPACNTARLCYNSRYDPHLSCWERQGEGVDQGAQRGEAGLDRLDVRRREQMQPGQEQTRTDEGLEQQPEVVERVLPAGARVPGGMGRHRGGPRENPAASALP